jgi:transcriptional regulator with XRE-family HTH domain
MPSRRLESSLIAQLREKKDWTQLDLAVRAKISDRSVRRAERGDSVDVDETLRPIARALGVKVDQLGTLVRDEDDERQLRTREWWLLIGHHGRRFVVGLEDHGKVSMRDLSAIAQDCRPKVGMWRRDSVEGITTTTLAVNPWQLTLMQTRGERLAKFELFSKMEGIEWHQEWEKEWYLAWPGKTLEPHHVPAGPGTAMRITPWRDPSQPWTQKWANGTWLKLSDLGGTYLVDLKNDGTLTETAVLSPLGNSSGHWWLDEGTPERALHIWVGHWKLDVRDDSSSRPYAATFAIDRAEEALFAPAVEHEPRIPRTNDFLIARMHEG